MPFVPPDLDCSSWSMLEPLYRALLDRPVTSRADLEQWLRDFADLDDIVDEYNTWAYIRHTCQTDDPEVEKAYMHVVEDLEPNVKPLYVALQKKFLSAARETGLDRDLLISHLAREWQADVDVYREANVPLQVEQTRLSTEYGKICGAMMVDYRGRPHTLQQMARYLEETDRVVREDAWRLVASRVLEDREPVERIFDRLLELRHEIARNAQQPDYRSYIWLANKRFDYTPEMCLQFGQSCEALIRPLIEELDEQAARDLGVSQLRPWDGAVDPKGRPPLRPFEPDDIEGFVEKTERMIRRMSPYFGERFATLRLGETLDLDSRRAKRPGGYQESLRKSRKPFIFMNAGGVHNDVRTLLHEGGHAFHAFEAWDHVELSFLRRVPTEFAEVASMSMELLAAGAYDEFYSSDEASRAVRKTIEAAIRLLPWIATIDGFQHWLYTHPGHTRDERTAYWLSLLDRFSSRAVEWSGLEDVRAANWQRQIHLFNWPFYYIEYGIAQLGALQLWLQYKQDPHRALANYRAALALGGTRPLPELFEAAGVPFDFSADAIAPLVDAVRGGLAALPA
jgi:oligoendopeptidase F